MSTAWLDHKSGEGDEITIFGATASELWNVAIDFENEDPLPTVIRHRPRGQRHPDQLFKTATVSRWLKVSKPTPNLWKVLVLYTTPDQQEQGSWNGWTIGSRMQSASRPLARGFPTTYTDNDNVIHENVRELIGPHAYRLATPDDTPTHQVLSPQTGKPVNLMQIRDGDAVATIPQPINIEEYFLVLSYTRTVPTMDYYKLRILGMLAGKSNNATWARYFPAKTLKLHDFGMTQEWTPNEEGEITASYLLTVDLIQNPEGWTPFEAFDTWRDPATGAQIEVVHIATNRLVRRVWEVGRTVSLDALFKILETPGPIRVTPTPIP